MQFAHRGSRGPLFLAILLSAALCVVLSAPAYGQYAVLDVKQFSATASITTAACTGTHTPLSADMCGQIQAAICALPTDGSGNPFGVVDARGFSGQQTCGSNPFFNPAIFGGRLAHLYVFCKGGDSCSLRRDFDLGLTPRIDSHDTLFPESITPKVPQ